MHKLTFGDGSIHYTDQGRGTAVVLLHGFCESVHVWDDWQDDLLEEGLRVIRIDLPGFGKSTASATTVEEMAEAVLAVTKARRLKSGVLVGHSMGGYVSLAVAAQQPDWLIGLSLFHSHPYEDDTDQRAARRKSIDFIERNGHIHYIKQLIPRLFAQNAGTSASFRRDLLILRGSRAKASAIVNAIRAMADRKDYSEWLRTYERPVLFINGGKDPIYTDRQRQDQTALPPVAEVCLLARAGHMGMIEERGVTQKAVRRFVAFCEQWP